MKDKKLTSLSDSPYKEDKDDFGTNRYVSGLIEFIKRSSSPITIALQGEWGSGKTSLMTRLFRALCSEPSAPFIGVEINTWEYSMLASPEVTVIKILSQLVNELSKGDDSIINKVNSFIQNAVSLVGKGVYSWAKATIPPVAVGAELLTAGADLASHSQGIDSVSLTDIKKSLQEIINRRLNEKKRGVIVFVDDLDRLNPPVAVEILELLKNVFTLDNCIFILAIDYEVVVKGLEPKFGQLTEKNEREFRSFFDKIIQVPFQLPVSSYRPMKFVLDSLEQINYFSELEADKPYVSNSVTRIVEKSVGKNPRSIKRLINTLSLLDCIDKCGDKASESQLLTETDEKMLNLIVVALQICYPKIYRLLARRPDFTTWDSDFALVNGIKMDVAADEKAEWTDVVEAACASDKFLKQHLSHIQNLLGMITEIMNRNQCSDELGKEMVKVIDKSSSTGVEVEFKTEEFDKSTLIRRLHANIEHRLRTWRPDIIIHRMKRVTENGGIVLSIDKNSRFDIKFSPNINSKNEIALRLALNLNVRRPERMMDMDFEEMLEADSTLKNAITKVDSVLTRLLTETFYFKGFTYGGQSTYARSYLEELRYIHSKGFLSCDITNNPNFYVDLKKPSLFEDPEIVNNIAEVIAANYDFRKAMLGWK